MSPSHNIAAELQELLAALREDAINDAQAERLTVLLRGNRDARRMYIHYMAMTATIRSRMLNPRTAIPFPQRENKCRADDELFAEGSSIGVVRCDSPADSPSPPAIVLDLSFPLPDPYSPHSSFLDGPVFSYMVATVILCVMLLGAWAYKITHYQQIVEKRSPSINQPEMQFVGQVTGMVDCRWSDPQTETYLGASAPLGRRYDLASGLMEITYTSGAKVILEGPCTYQVESFAGGYLALGKLTAKVEGSGFRGQGSEKTNLQISKSPNQPIPSSFILHPSSFVVRTPTAIVTDLGTEFGVEVSENGDTTSHVFHGSVKVRAIGNGRQQNVVLRKNESAEVKRGPGGSFDVVRKINAPPAAFVRRMPRWTPFEVFSTGVGVKEGEADPHWQIVAVSNDPHFQPRPAVVTSVRAELFRPNDPVRSQWISTAGDLPDLPNGVTYTFRTTFELRDIVPGSAVLRVGFLADNHVKAIRLNGEAVRIPEHGYFPPFDRLHPFTVSKGFIEGANVLEIEVSNEDVRARPAPVSPMTILVEMEGSVIRKWRAPIETSNHTPQASGRKERNQ